MTKRVFCLLIALSMVFGMLITGTVAMAAEGSVAAMNAQGVIANYATLEEAIADPNATWFRLNGDLDGQTIAKNILLDLNGHSLTNTYIPEGVTLTGIDSATDDYTGAYGTLSGVVEGSVATTAKTEGEVKSYVTVCENGSYSFHRYYAAIAAISLQPSQAGLGYRAEFRGDETVKNAVVDYGYELWVNDGTHKTYTRADKLERSSLTLRLKNIMAQGNDALNAFGATATIGGNAFVTLELNGEQITLSGTQQQTTLRQVIESINANVGTYGQAQLESVRDLCTAYAAWMLGWDTENIFGDGQGEGSDGLKVEIVVDVTAENNVLSQNATLAWGDICASVPQGTTLEDGTTQLVLTITEKADSDSGVETAADQTLLPLDVHIAGISSDNTTPIIVCLGAILPEGLNIGNYKLYHVENGEAVEMSYVTSTDQLDAHNEFYYEPATGCVTISVASFSEISAVAEQNNIWNGNIADSFSGGDGTSADPWIIANADQLAYMSRIVSENADYADDCYKLVSDVDFGGYSNTVDENDVPTNVFYPIGYWKLQDGVNAAGELYYGYGNSFRGVFDGNGNTVANLCQRTWDMDGNYDYGYWDDAMGLFGAVFNATIKNLTMDNFRSDGEFTPTGCVAAYAGGNSTFENIYLTNCNPCVYNTANGGIVGLNYNSTSGTEDHLVFRNITVDQTNMITALWGSWDVSCGGILGRLRDSSLHEAGQCNTATFENCHVSAVIDVYNDVCANYQYYQYRYAGMLIGTVDYIDMGSAGYGVDNLDKVLSATDCTVTYGDWNQYWYCELVSNSQASYTNDYQFSRLTKITQESDIQDEEGNWSRTGNFVIPATNEEKAVCYHIVKDAEGNLYQHLHENAGLDDGYDVDQDGQTDLKENRQHYYIPFGQLFTGYGWGSTPVREYDGVTVNDGGTVKAQEKFTASQSVTARASGKAITIGDLFAAAVEDSVISKSTLQVFVSPADETSTVSGVYVGNSAAWENGTLTFKGTGAAKILITDYFYCTPTVLNITVTCGHEDATVSPAVAPTCKEMGYTEGLYCPVCKDYFSGREPVAALGHSWGEDNVCTNSDCGVIRVVIDQAFDANTDASFTLDAGLEGTSSVVTQTGTDGNIITLANATLIDGTLTIPAKSFTTNNQPTGQVVLEVNTDLHTYYVEGLEITWVIHSWPELAVMERHMVADGNSYTGSLALGADLSMEKAHVGNWLWRNSELETFNGTFDGRGYTISDFNSRATLKGIFKNLGADGVVKNLRMTNATITTYAAAVVGYQCYGILENIYVQGSITDDGLLSNSQPINFGSSLLAGHIYPGAKVRNVIVDVQQITTDEAVEERGVPVAFGYLRNGAAEAEVFENCYAVNAGNLVIRFVQEGSLARTCFQSNGNYISMWKLWQNETAKELAVSLGIAEPAEPVITTTPVALTESFDMNTDVDFTYTDAGLTGTLTQVSVKGMDIVLAADLTNGVLTVPAASFVQETMPSGQLTLVAETASACYELTGDFTWVIQDWGNAIGGLAYMHKHLVNDGNVYTGALALGADIDLTGKSIGNFTMFQMANEFDGTFDGRNHTITGLQPAATTGLFGTVGTNGVVENLKLTGVQITTYGGGVAYICKGTLRNIYVEGAITADGMSETSDLANFGSGLLAGIFDSTAKVNNCIVELRSITSNLRLATAFGRMRNGTSENIFTNCYAIGATGNTFSHYVDTDYVKADFTTGSNANFTDLEELVVSENELAIELATMFGLITE